MFRYIIIAVALLVVFPCSQSSAQPPPDIMSIHLIDQQVGGQQHNLFSRHNYTVKQILQDLLSIIDQANLQDVIARFGGDPAILPAFTDGNAAQFRVDLDYLINVFPQNVDVFSQPLAAGEKSFTDEFGNFFTTDEPELFTPLPFTTTYILTFNAGGNTALAPLLDILENVEIVTRDNRYRIFAFDNGRRLVGTNTIPTLDQWGMIILALLLATMAVGMLHRRRV